MKEKRLTEIAEEIYFTSLGERTDWNELRTEYGLSETELNRIASIVRERNRSQKNIR